MNLAYQIHFKNCYYFFLTNNAKISAILVFFTDKKNRRQRGNFEKIKFENISFRKLETPVQKHLSP